MQCELNRTVKDQNHFHFLLCLLPAFHHMTLFDRSKNKRKSIFVQIKGFLSPSVVTNVCLTQSQVQKLCLNKVVDLGMGKNELNVDGPGSLLSLIRQQQIDKICRGRLTKHLSRAEDADD